MLRLSYSIDGDQRNAYRRIHLNKLATICMTGLLAVGAQAFADDSSMTQNQSFKDCMEKQKATNSSMTQTAMETVCKNEAKRNKSKSGNNLASGTQDTNDTGKQDPKPQE
jgi:hypothetical protein